MRTVPVLLPVAARLLPRRIAELDLVFTLEELYAQALRHVPRNVAVHQPGTRVVGGEGDHDPSAAGEEGDVAAVRVVEGEGGCLGVGVEDTGAAA